MKKKVEGKGEEEKGSFVHHPLAAQRRVDQARDVHAAVGAPAGAAPT